MVNPFVSVERQLKKRGYIKLQEGDWGFIFAKGIGGGYINKVEFSKGIIKFYDPDILHHDAAGMTIEELELFIAKIKEWRRQYGCNSEDGRHYSKERS